MSRCGACFSPTNKILVEVPHWVLARLPYLVASWNVPERLCDAANLELQSFLADRIALFRQSLHSTVLRRVSFVSFGERIVSVFDHFMPLLSDAVIVFRDFNSDKASTHLMGDKS